MAAGAIMAAAMLIPASAATARAAAPVSLANSAGADIAVSSGALRANPGTASADVTTAKYRLKNLDTGHCALFRGVPGKYALDGPCGGSPAANREWELTLRVVGLHHLVLQQ
jgi:opacity protein-like surface antigen